MNDARGLLISLKGESREGRNWCWLITLVRADVPRFDKKKIILIIKGNVEMKLLLSKRSEINL